MKGAIIKSIYHSHLESNSCHIFVSLIKCRESGVGATSNEGFNRSWGLSLTGMDFSGVSFFCLYFRDNFFC